jgi:phosphatidate cytidylyltransferase
MLAKRVESAAIFGPLLVLLTLLDGFPKLQGLPLLVIAVAVGALGTEEAARLMRARSERRSPDAAASVEGGGKRPQKPDTEGAGVAQRDLYPPLWLGGCAGALPPLFLYFWKRADYEDWVLLILTLAIVFAVLTGSLAVISDVARRKLWALRDSVVVGLAGVYVGGLISSLLFLRRLGDKSLVPWGCWVALLAFGATWAADIGAYFGGKAWGRRALWKRVSPGKTVEGSVVGAAACGLLMLAAYGIGLRKFVSAPTAFVMGLALGVVGLGGDLAESRFKRWAEAKDSGALIPGHGGVLDRFDSLLWVGPVLYFLIRAWIGS